MGLISFFRGYVSIRIIGAEPEKFINVLSEKNIPFWDLRREDELHYTLSLYQKYIKTAEKLSYETFCSCEILEFHGLRQWMQKAKMRPVLTFGLPLALLCSLLLQNVVLAVDVEGNEKLHREEIIHALEELGIGVGSPSWNIDQQLTKNQMLNLLPELSWIGVNRSGCKLHVLVTERSFPKVKQQACPAANLIAARDGVLTDVIVTEGMKLCRPGDTVRKGQVLVSGFEDYGLILKGVCAEGEIYGQTWRSGTIVTPSSVKGKVYTGREWADYSLVIGRKRINLSGNSGISGASCDKMIDAAELQIPNYSFPVRLEKTTFREYNIKELPLDPEAGEANLLSAWERLTASDMIAGKTESTETSFMASDGLYILRAESVCNEMLARLRPMDGVCEGEAHE